MPSHYLTDADASDSYRLPTILTRRMPCDPSMDQDEAAIMARTVYTGARARLAGRIADALRWERQADALSNRSHDCQTLADVEQAALEAANDDHTANRAPRTDADLLPSFDIGAGWYWSICLPGCLPDSDWSGPHATEAQAVDSARRTHAD